MESIEGTCCAAAPEEPEERAHHLRTCHGLTAWDADIAVAVFTLGGSLLVVGEDSHTWDLVGYQLPLPY